jgi:hypothetical protein
MPGITFSEKAASPEITANDRGTDKTVPNSSNEKNEIKELGVRHCHGKSYEI